MSLAELAVQLKDFVQTVYDLRSKGRDWQGDLVPFALLGKSMPAAIRDYVEELSAPHEGVKIDLAQPATHRASTGW